MKTLVLSSGSSHGAYQAGVLMALEEIGWKPDIILGTSVGSINASAFASGIEGHDLAAFWLELTNRDVFKARPVLDWLSFWKWDYILDTKPLLKYLKDRLDISKVSLSDIHVLATGTDISSGRQILFSSKYPTYQNKLSVSYDVLPLTLESLLASSAIPIIFPSVKGVWDGAFQQHNPLKPAILLGSNDILVVKTALDGKEKVPKGILQNLGRALDLTSSMHLNKDIELLLKRNTLDDYKEIEIGVIHPEADFGYSRLNFDDTIGKVRAIRMGYDSTMKHFKRKKVYGI